MGFVKTARMDFLKDKMNSYDRLLTLLVETKMPLPPTHHTYPLGNPQLKYIVTSPENVMSGATRAQRKEWRRTQRTQKGTRRESDTLGVTPQSKSGMARRDKSAARGRVAGGRKARIRSFLRNIYQ